jgi:fatty-acid peroxygenase
MTHTALRATGIPRLPAFDSTLAFLRDGYTFGERAFTRLGTDAFRTRLLGLPVTIVRGADAARMFYEEDRFGRDRAMPASAQHLLQDKRSAQTLTGDAHRNRKHALLRMLADGEALGRLREFFAEEWFRALEKTPVTFSLHDELITILTRAGIRWVGSLPDDHDIDMLADELGSMIENAGRIGPPNWIARLRRQRSEAWAAALIADVRAERRVVARGSVLRQIADYTEHGQALSERDAAVELLNVLRPIVAVGRYMVFAALALERHPRWRDRFAGDDANGGGDVPVEIAAEIENFVNEVRRFYPFFPMVGGRALRRFSWHGRDFKPGSWVLLDLYGTNHDESIWADAHRFVPERFLGWDGDRNALIPQGGGDEQTGHRCAGERATIELMMEAVRLFTRETDYTVPDQDLRVSLKRFPALPESGFLMANPTRRHAA